MTLRKILFLHRDPSLFNAISHNPVLSLDGMKYRIDWLIGKTCDKAWLFDVKFFPGSVTREMDAGQYEIEIWGKKVRLFRGYIRY